MQARSQVCDAETALVGRAASSASAGAVVIGGAYGSLALARSLGRRGIPVWFFNSGHPIARFSRYVRRSLAWPAGVSDQIQCLLETGERNQLRGWTLFPGGDQEAELLARHHSTLKRPCGQLIVVDDGYDLFLTLTLYPNFGWDDPAYHLEGDPEGRLFSELLVDVVAAEVIEPWGGGKWHMEIFRSINPEPEDWNGEM